VFSKAWLKSISPEAINCGFRVCGIYPFNPSVILSKSPESPNKKDASSDDQESHDCEQAGNQSTEAAVTFTAVEEQLFLRWYEEGYNLPDSKYISWLKMNHPKADSTIFLLSQACLIIFLTLVLLMLLQYLMIFPIVKQKQKNVLPLLTMPLPQGGKMKLVA